MSQRKLRKEFKSLVWEEIEKQVKSGVPIAKACRNFGMTDQAYRRRRNMKINEASE